MTRIDEHELYSDHATAEPGQVMDMLGARQVALSLLDIVLVQKQSLDSALERHAGFYTLPGRDKAFCRMLVSTTLRRLGQIDDLIIKAENRPSSSSNPSLLNILRMGVTQIMFMDVPDHAAVDTSVRLTEAAGMSRQKSFTNALLRTITRTGREWVSRQDEARLNTPDWLLKIWIEDYGLRTAAEIARANLGEAPLDLTLKSEKDRNYWTSTFKATEIGNGTLRCPTGGSVQDMHGFEDGAWWVQDASAAIPAGLFGDIEGKITVDLCAAPGGKTLQLAAKGAKVISVDRSAQRLKRLYENLERMRLQDHVEIFAADAGEWTPKAPPEFILLDAPCTATGTIRRHPDVAYLKTPRDLESLVGLQARLLDHAYRMLKPGGVLVYCTCSLQKSEGEAQVQKIFERYETAMKLPISANEIGGIEEAVTEYGDVRILPQFQAALGGMDGFFISRLTKTS